MSRTSPLATGSVAPQWEPSSAMLALLDRLRSGAELVTGERTTRRGRRAMQAEVGGEAGEHRHGAGADPPGAGAGEVEDPEHDHLGDRRVITTDQLPVYSDRATGPGLRVLRRMLAGEPLVATRTGPGAVACTLGGYAAGKATVAGLIARGLVEPAADTPASTLYRLTAAGEAEARQ